MPRITLPKDSPTNRTIPKKYFRADLFTFEVSESFESELNFSVIRQWRIFQMDTGVELFIADNPTLYSPRIVIRSNTFDFKRYSLVYFLTMKLDTGYLQSIKNEFTTSTKLYIDIISSGIQVFGLQNGVDNIVIGNQQEIFLYPRKFSFDMDGYSSTENFQFKFYCYLVDSNKANASFNGTLIKDLMSLKNVGTVDFNSCFNSTGKLKISFYYKKMVK